MAILFWLFFIFIVVGGLFYIIAVIAGVGSVISAKRKGISFKEQTLANALGQANKLMEKRKAKEIRRGYAPNVQVEVRVVQAAPKDETLEQREAREKAEARKRYLDSLVDR
jgi:hypothetical protein